MLGAGAAMWIGWQSSTALGVWLGAQSLGALPLDFALPLTFIALVVPALKDRAHIAALAAAGLLGVLTLGLPFKLGLMAATLVGIGVGVWIEAKGSPSLSVD
jgi:predicted branched-subunit amino acid permease